MSKKALIEEFLVKHNASPEILLEFSCLRDGYRLNFSTLNFNNEQASKYLDLPNDIADWCLPVRVANCLKNENIDIKQKLFSLTENQLLKIPNFGRRCLRQLKEEIHPCTFPRVEAVTTCGPYFKKDDLTENSADDRFLTLEQWRIIALLNRAVADKITRNSLLWAGEKDEKDPVVNTSVSYKAEFVLRLIYRVIDEINLRELTRFRKGVFE